MTQAALSARQESAYRSVLRTALTAGREELREGGDALDAVSAAIVVMERTPLFNAGCGAVRTSAHTMEMDAAIMDGRARAAGAVTGVRVAHPIRLARAVMDSSRHVMLAGQGAEAFAREQGLDDPLPDDCPEPRGSSGDGAWPLDKTHGTVGAVALDAEGNLAAGTSTGGLSGKRVGRVGDSPIVGAGTYASNQSVAVSATGQGEYFIRSVAAHGVAARVRFGGASVPAAARAAVEEAEALGGTGGVIALGPDGTMAMPFTTAGMFRAFVGPDGEMAVRIF
jgi:beta-aspartyl-peptidase (threonine type)